jgi:hypothetical protein
MNRDSFNSLLNSLTPQSLWLGIVLPILLLSAVIVQLILQRAYWISVEYLPYRLRLVSGDDAALLAGLAVAETGAAACLFAWHLLAHGRYRRHSTAVMLAALLVCLAGAALAIARAVWLN